MMPYIKFQEKKLQILRLMVGNMHRMISLSLSIMMRVRIGTLENKIRQHLLTKLLLP